METVFEVSNNIGPELIEAKNKIRELEERIRWLEAEVKDKEELISAIQNNMTRQYVEDWEVTDNDGKRGNFCGVMYWIKGDGTVYYKNKTHFEGMWDSTGEIMDGKLFDRNGELIAEWEDGEEIEEEDDKSDE